jgi:hypothetical protein
MRGRGPSRSCSRTWPAARWPFPGSRSPRPTAPESTYPRVATSSSPPGGAHMTPTGGLVILFAWLIFAALLAVLAYLLPRHEQDRCKASYQARSDRCHRPASRERPGTPPGTSAPRPRWQPAESGSPPRSATEVRQADRPRQSRSSLREQGRGSCDPCHTARRACPAVSGLTALRAGCAVPGQVTRREFPGGPGRMAGWLPGQWGRWPVGNPSA